MAIATTSLNSAYFVLDVPDVRWTSAADGKSVRVTIVPENGESVQFTEDYTADADGAITLRGLAELIESYVKPCPTPLRQDLVISHGVWLATVVRASFTAQLFDEEGNTIAPNFHSYAYYASQRTKVTPGATAIWLTRYTDRTISPVQPITLSVLMRSSLTARFVVESVSDGLISTATVAIALPSSASVAGTPPAYAAVVHYTLADLASAAHVGASEIRRVVAELMSGGSVVDSVTYHIDHRHRPQLHIVAFTNCFGMLETEALSGSDERTTTMDAEYAWIDREYDKTNQALVTADRLCAGHISDAQRQSLQDLAASPEVYLCHDNGTDCWDKMTVVDLEMSDRRPRTSPQTAYVTLRRSARHQEVVDRTGSTDEGDHRDRIFDYTFDNTFN